METSGGVIIPTHKRSEITIGTKNDKEPIIGPREDNGKNDAKLDEFRSRPPQSRILWIIDV